MGRVMWKELCHGSEHSLGPAVCVLWQGGDRGFAFTSGMAALVAVVRLVAAGQHIVAGDDIYGGTSRLLLSVVPHQGIEVTNVDMTDVRCLSSPATHSKRTTASGLSSSSTVVEHERPRLPQRVPSKPSPM